MQVHSKRTNDYLAATVSKKCLEILKLQTLFDYGIVYPYWVSDVARFLGFGFSYHIERHHHRYIGM